MKLSYNWLKEYINIKLSPGDLAEGLTMAGLEVKAIDHIADDYIFEAEITSNRPDWLSVYGVAREIQAITGATLKQIDVKLQKETLSLKPSIIIEDKKGCPRYTGRVIEGIEVGVSPKWLADKLAVTGIRAVNNIVDITNFCLLEQGQPLHAFDYDKIEGTQIIVRRAKKGEEIVTIDGVKRQLNESILVIADAKKPVAIAGVMGGKETEVTFSTKRILLESAYFDAPLIRTASKSLGISTDSSYRFERAVDSGNVLFASNRAATLICDLAKAKAISKIADIGAKPLKRAKIILKISKANKILGLKISDSKCASILKGLDLEIKKKNEDTLDVTVPSFRGDLKEEIDLIEEISRVYGYDKIPEVSAGVSVRSNLRRKSPERAVEEITREILSGAGLNEVITYSLIGRNNRINKIFNTAEDKLVKIQNPLSLESEVLRPSVLCGLMDVLSHNASRKILDMRIFEIGKSYFYDKNGAASEKNMLAIALCGAKAKDWRNKTAIEIFDLKGIVEALFERLGIQDYEFEAKLIPLFSPAVSSLIKVGGVEIGILGKIDKAVLDSYDIKTPVFVSEFDLEPICASAKLERKFTGLPRFPSVTRDISLIVGDVISNGQIVGLIKRVCGDLAVSVKPFDLYKGEQVPNGAKSILYCVEYRAPDRTLIDEEVNTLDKRVREALVENFGAKIR